MPAAVDLTATAFFAPDSCPAPELFAPNRPVWEALTELKDFFRRAAGPGLPVAIAPDPAPLPATLVLYRPPAADPATDWEVIAGRECEITLADATKGKLAVRHRGELLGGATVLMAGAVLQGRDIELGAGVLVEAGAFLKEPLRIGDCCEIRQGAYLRGHCLVGRRCVVGHVSEVKHTIFCDDAKAGHFAYLGDSILGAGVNLGAGTKLANLRFTGGRVKIRCPGQLIDSGLSKLGAILADGCQTGCNAVTNPGTLLGRDGIIAANTTAPSGWHPPRTVLR